jgi:hypothetical protein
MPPGRCAALHLRATLGGASVVRSLPWVLRTAARERSVTLILRLVLDGRGRLEYGEAVDTEARSQGRFVGWRGLTRTVRAWLARQEEPGG